MEAKSAPPSYTSSMEVELGTERSSGTGAHSAAMTAQEVTNACSKPELNQTREAGSWIDNGNMCHATSAEVFSRDIDSLHSGCSREGSFQAKDQHKHHQSKQTKQSKPHDTKRDRVKQWLRNSGPRTLHVVATTAMFVFNIVSLCC